MTSQDNNINVIRQIVLKYIPEASVILFGSRAKGNFDDRSDYDVMAIYHGEMRKDDMREIRQNIRKELAEERIAIDIVVTTDAEIKRISELTNHIINEALTTGVEI